jgi:retron-type reverse transcriptase
MTTTLMEDIYQAYLDARKNKRNTINQLKFELRLEENLLRLHKEIAQRTYRVGRSVAFIIERPVKREVFAASFADRVIHHLYFNYVNEIFERAFIPDCYSCRLGKGTSYGIKRLEHHIRSCSDNYQKETWVLKLDLSGYFMSINRNILNDKIVNTLNKYATRRNHAGVRFGDALDYDLLMFLTREIVNHDPITNCFIKGQMDEWEGLPADKSLFASPQSCGLPIGNLTSQLFSNVYLNDFDQWMKRDQKIEHYGRYVDDFYLVHNSKQFLAGKIEEIKSHLKNSLGIRVHPRKIYLQPIQHGVPFLGVVVKPYRTLIARRTVANFKTAMARGEKYYKQEPDKLVEVLNSYLGLMIHYDTFKLRQKVMDKCQWVNLVGELDTNIRKFAQL